MEGGLMTLFFYTHHQDKHKKKELESIYPYAEWLNHESVLTQEELNIKNKPWVLIFIGQPKSDYIQSLSKLSWDLIISNPDIRLLENMSVDFYYEKTSEIINILKSNDTLFLSKLKRNYIEQLADFRGMPFKDCYKKCVKEEKSSHFRFFNDIKNAFSRKNLNLKSGVITIVGDGEMASEYAKFYAEYTKKKTVIVDCHLLKPCLDIYFKKRNLKLPFETHFKGNDCTGLNIALDLINKKIRLKPTIQHLVISHSKKLHVLFGNYNLYHYEHYQHEDFMILIEELKSSYDTVILSVEDYLYDAFTITAMHQSQMNIIVCEDNSKDIRYKQKFGEILSYRQNIPLEKNNFILFRKSKKLVFQDETLRMIFKKQFMGSLSPCSSLRKKKKKYIQFTQTEKG